ncbi:hypothetical protein [Nocardia lijiangensis]|uniref:Cap15 family cyclic dinucleotide receptor domain-containing protein n=1 Tax=Nocardia lijiangensis TaxID=299618 RepID=UPI0008303EFD|nr:hypothetical protein [Nocardia lijiangensis]
MTNKTLIKVTAYLMVAAFVVILLGFGIDLPIAVTRIAFALPVLAVVVFWLYDSRAWRWPWLLRVARKPWLGGTWVGTTTTRRQVHGNEIELTRQVVFRISQTSDEVGVVMMMEHSKSGSLASSIGANSDGEYMLSWMYDCRPTTGREGQIRHRGSAVAEFHGSKPQRLDGDMWTESGVRSTFQVALVSRTPASTYAAGIDLHRKKVEQVKALLPAV